jgi:hypothetical protein
MNIIYKFIFILKNLLIITSFESRVNGVENAFLQTYDHASYLCNSFKYDRKLTFKYVFILTIFALLFIENPFFYLMATSIIQTVCRHLCTEKPVMLPEDLVN